MKKEPIDKPFGYLRETAEKAYGHDESTGLNRTGLDDYLTVIFRKNYLGFYDWAHSLFAFFIIIIMSFKQVDHGRAEYPAPYPSRSW